MRGELNTRRKIKIGQNKPCQLLGHMSSNMEMEMEMESHILETSDLRGRKKLYLLSQSVNVVTILKINFPLVVSTFILW